MSTDLRSNMEIVVVALAKLGGTTRKIATEQIAYEAFNLAPDRFSWVLKEFQRLPDKQVAGTALEDAAKEKYGALVEGKCARDLSKDGWILTPNGIRWWEQNRQRILSSLAIDKDQIPSLSPTEVHRLRAFVRREPAFQTYLNTGSLETVTRFMFTDMLQCSPDAPADLIHYKFNRLLSQAKLAQDDDLTTFLLACEVQFRDLLDSKSEV